MQIKQGLASSTSSTSLAPFALEEEEESPPSGAPQHSPGVGVVGLEDEEEDDDEEEEEVEADHPPVKPRAASQAWPIPSNEPATVTSDAWVAASSSHNSPTASSSLDTVGSEGGAEGLRMVMSLPALSSSGGSSYQHFPTAAQQQQHYNPFGISPSSGTTTNRTTTHSGFSPSSLPGSLGSSTSGALSASSLLRTSSGSNLSSLLSGGGSGGASGSSTTSSSCPVLQILTNNHFVPTQVSH